MFINLYINPRSATSQKTINALKRYGIPFLTHCADDPEPLIDVDTEDDIFFWRGHRPDLIELLADLDGVLPARAIERAADHGEADVLTRAQAITLITHAARNPNAFFSDCGDEPLYRGATVLGWLRL